MDFTRFRKEKVFQRGRGGSDAQHQADEALFHKLLERHEEIERHSRKIANGIETTTRITSGDRDLVKILQTHALGMKERFDGNRAIRSWDPLFVSLFDHRHEITFEYEMLEDGIRVRLGSENPEVQKIIDLHDQTLHAFIRYGFVAAREESPYTP
ncbi:MAG TPA: hypothetical protein ENK97_03860 [Campylobacteraceae bacterium]|jgi:hypothetical protein|nr:hypothetical protein [Campylobacteraceae bacterium]